MTYAPPLADIACALDHAADYGALAATARFAEAGAELRDAALAEAGRLAAEVLAPLDAAGDRAPARLENGAVRVPAGFAEAHAAIGAGGWIGLAADPAHGGQGLPQAMALAVREMFASANLSLSLCPLLSEGQIEALEAHAPDDVKATCLPRLIAGEWTGAMCLTEPQAGTDLAAIRTRAEPDGDGGFRLHGQKIFITWGDHDMTENILHLVLARLPDAAAGAKGLSLFLASRRLIGEDGRPGAANAMRPLSLERKMGIHASPTAVMAYEGARARLIGPAHGGLACMFTMMNNARLGVAAEGVGMAEAALQAARAHARERVQGRTPTGEPTIIGHPDVRRMLAAMAARAQGGRVVACMCATAGDMARALDGEAAAGWAARAAFLTPIAKAFCTDMGVEAASLGVQVHGGAGYVEDAGAAQLLRDARITPIYEGTNGVQAMDLVGRKLADGGVAARALLEEIPTAGALGAHRAAVSAATDWMLAASTTDRQAGAVDYLRAWGLLLAAHGLAKAAAAEPARAALAAYALRREAPAIAGLCAAATDGAATLYADGAQA